jgi:anthranilate phosphoribosyltransferase
MSEFHAVQLLDKLLDGIHLTTEEATWIMEQCMEGEIPAVQMGSILTALRQKKETIEEITACAKVMRQKATQIPTTKSMVIDTCGTGGDGKGTFNISTTVALALAAGGYTVAKHGNRSMTSKSGSADVLEALGVNLQLTPAQVGKSIDDIGIGFLFAPALHSAMKNVVPVRKELGVRTIFNILGPLTNPANANVQVIGLFSSSLVDEIAEVLRELGTLSAYVVAGEDGLDEVSLCAPTKVARLKPDKTIDSFQFNPEDYGFSLVSIDQLKGGTPEENASITKEVLSGRDTSAKTEIVVLNAGFAISALENCSLKEGFAKARGIIESGSGLTLIEKLSKFTGSFAN